MQWWNRHRILLCLNQYSPPENPLVEAGWVVLAFASTTFRHGQLEENSGVEVMHQGAKAPRVKSCDYLGNDKPEI